MAFPTSLRATPATKKANTFVGPNRNHIVSDRDKFYKDAADECYPDGQCQDEANFYCKNGVGDVPQVKRKLAAAATTSHIDEFGKVQVL